MISYWVVSEVVSDIILVSGNIILVVSEVVSRRLAERSKYG